MKDSDVLVISAQIVPNGVQLHTLSLLTPEQKLRVNQTVLESLINYGIHYASPKKDLTNVLVTGTVPLAFDRTALLSEILRVEGAVNLFDIRLAQALAQEQVKTN